jgi:hypothetical protein
MYPLRDQRAKIETLIPRLCRKELAGFAVKLHRYIVDIPERSSSNRLMDWVFPLSKFHLIFHSST